MIISNSATTTPLQPGNSSTPNGTPPADPTKTAVADAKPGTQGIKRLSSDAATVVLTEQGTGKASQAPAQSPPPPPPPPPKLDLHGQDLRTVDLTKLDLRSADLTGADLTGKDLSGIDLSGATLTGAKFDGAIFTHANLHGVSAKGASFAKAYFDHTDLDNADFTEAKFTSASFGRINADRTQPLAAVGMYWDDVDGSNFSKCDFAGADIWQVSCFKHCNSDGANFNDVKFSSFTFINGSLKGASFQHISGYVSCGGADASNTDFSNIDGATLNIGQSKLDGATFSNSRFNGLGIADADLTTVNMSVKDKDLRKAYFANCIMTGMDFSGYDFSGAQFFCYGRFMESPFQSGSAASTNGMVENTDFRGAKFAGAQFHNMDMRGALLSAGALRGTTINYWGDLLIHVDREDYDINKLFRNIWPELAEKLRRMQLEKGEGK